VAQVDCTQSTWVAAATRGLGPSALRTYFQQSIARVDVAGFAFENLTQVDSVNSFWLNLPSWQTSSRVLLCLELWRGGGDFFGL